MTNTNTVTIAESFNKLPTSTQSLLESGEMTQAIYTVLQNTPLSQKDRDTCQEMMLRVMVGITTTKDFATTVQNTLSIDSDGAKLLSANAEKKVFSLVRDDLLQVFKKNKTETKTPDSVDSKKDVLSDPYKEPV